VTVGPTPASSLEVEDALLRAGTKLGLRAFLLRLVAAELPDNPWLVDLHVQPQAEGVVARASHLCGPACNAVPDGCLTAFKVEDAVTKRTGVLHQLRAVRAEGRAVVVELDPVR
jgi:hypothetical protein